MSIRIEDLEGMQYPRDGTELQQKDYAYFNQQYATSSHQKDHYMNPSLIVQPKGDHNIIKIWCIVTSGKNIQIDLTNTYKDMMVFNPTGLANKTYVYAGVSNRLKDFNAYLTYNKLFVPHGFCAYVCVGGHAQTGGYGQLSRSFGLFGDHVRLIRMVDYNGAIIKIPRILIPISSGQFSVAVRVIQRIDLIYNPDHYLNGEPGQKNYERYLGCKLAVQIQNYGGNFARFTTNRNNGTPYSWRDSSIVQVFDCFHKTDDDSKHYAEEWAAKNDMLMNGPNGFMGDWNMSDEKVWKCYYEDEDKYKKLGVQRAKADPDGTFTPNPFAVSRV
ncbi:hypothetical protein TWF594_005822 [Orbilia oligospora]|nr:hypothetical protein TWF594_005822 [Orbilia oligospora]